MRYFFFLKPIAGVLKVFISLGFCSNSAISVLIRGVVMLIFWALVKKAKFLLPVLILLEFLILVIFLLLILFIGLRGFQDRFLLLRFLVIVSRESVLGLVIFVLVSRQMRKDYISLFSVIKF